ncbi:MAG TPA: SRPBCC family protein [Candidatus Limnocylindrales bacterium]|nr:SRPBCC family protein [Candidatus Limnocylindrales bacterium]
MAISVQFETVIARSVDDVFAQLAAVERFPEWLVASGIVRVERAPGPLQTGTALRIEQRIAGRATTLEGAIAALEPARRLAFRAKDREGISVEAEALLSPEGAGCRLRWSVKIGLPLKFRLFESMAAPEARRAAATDLENLRRRLESVAG